MRGDLVHILHLEDHAADAELVEETLRSGGIRCEITRVDTAEAFYSALESGGFDLVLSDFSLPGFNGLSALAWLQEHHPDIPFVFISGTMGEESAVDSLHRGATDYILKGRLARLCPAVRRALEDAQARRDRVHAEETIRELAALLDKTPDAIYVLDLHDRVRFWSKGAERLYGWSADEILGRPLPPFAKRRDSIGPEAIHKALLDHDQWGGELSRLAKGGRSVVVDSRWALLRDAGAQPRSVLVIDSDVTEKKALQAQVLRAQRMESIGTLAGGIAHDLNNVLAPILMATDILRRRLSDEKSHRVLGTIESSARRGADLVRQILTFARGIEGERIPLQPRTVMKEVEKIVRETFPKAIEVRVEAPETLWRVMADATQIHQVLLNLCVNARDAMPLGGSLILRARNASLTEFEVDVHADARAGRYVVLEVADTGDGIAPGLIGRIFDPFFTTKEPGKGTGLGLSTSLAIVRSHGGFIHVTSEPKRGAHFKVYLPATVDSSQADAAERVSALLIGHGETVLVVDDEASIREISRETLETYGYRVLTASDGVEALAVYTEAAGEVAVVVTDLAMPFMDGVATLRALQRLNPAVKVIATSGRGDAEELTPAETGGPQAFLPKPYTAEKLLSALFQVLSG
jgi:PAS domain S-box-containing protein